MIERLTAALSDRYRIERKLGEGGMATVYLAEDLKHSRRVAVKVLKPELAAVVGAERFLAEIETTAGLQHPNILPLFDSGDADGSLYFVMPYVDGETLADRLQRERQLPVEEAVRIATAVANALQAAHEKGVIHRDIKPANILLSRGEPLVADFGIALAVGAAGGSRLTETGLSVGTPFYMSPEQATGDQGVGPATDVYALGCVLYETLVGEPPFVGNTAQAVLGKILQGEAAPVTASRKSVPAHVDAAIRKALERLPADRFPSAQGFARALGDAAFRYGDRVGSSAGGAGGPWRIAALVAAGVAAAAAAVAGWALSRPPGAAYPPMNVVVGIPDDEAFTGYGSFDLSPDGSFIVYQGPAEDGVNQLWVRRLSELRGEPIPGTRNGVLPSVSPDGADVVFQGSGFPVRSLQVASLTGGGVRTVVDSAWCCPAWGEDGWIYYTGVDKALMRVSAAGGEPEVVVPSRPGKTTWEPRLGPGGDWAIQNVGGDGPTRIQVVDLASGDTAVVPGGVSPVPVPWGDLVYMTQDRMLVSVPFDPAARRVTGTPVVLATDLYDSGDEVGHFALSRDGQVLAYRRRGESAAAWAAYWLGEGAPQPVDPDWTADVDWASGGVAVSPEGDRVAFAVRIEGQSEVFVKRLPAGAEVRLSASDAWDGLPAWTPDGRYVTFLSDRSGAAQLYRRRADGGGTTEIFLEDPRGVAQATWSPGGDWLVYRTNRFQAGSGDILAIRPGVDSLPRTLAGSQFTEEDPDISPDGRWMVYASNETGRSDVFVVPFPDTDGPRIPVSSRGGFWPRWSSDGQSLYYVGLDGRGLVRVDLELEPPYLHRETVVMDGAGLEGWGAAESAPYDVDPASGRLMGLLSPGAEVETELVVVQGVRDRVRAARERRAP